MLKQKHLDLNRLSIIKKNTEGKVKKDKMKTWRISIGLYPGVLIGIRTYEQEDVIQHVVYLPFIDIAFEYIKEN
tara:strand:- start:693 stop:914 length:222 start_codon:yes stop_codon:yes gene_type:complete